MLAYLFALFAPALAGSEVVMELEAAHLPLVGADIGTEHTGGQDRLDLLLVGRFRGVGPRQTAGVHWGSAAIAARLDLLAPDADRLRGELSVARWVGETYPVPVVWDVRFATAGLAREERLGQALDAQLTATSAVAGFYFPSVGPGDFDGYAVAEAAVGGVHRRNYAIESLSPFTGAYLGAIGTDIQAGRALAHGVILAPTFTAKAEWSLGMSETLAVVTDTSVAVGLTLRLGRHVAIRVDGGAESTRDPGNGLAASYYRAAARLRVGS